MSAIHHPGREACWTHSRLPVASLRGAGAGPVEGPFGYYALIMRKIPVTVVLALGLVSLSQAAIYQWQDAGGKTEYGDNPPPGVIAEPVELRPLSTVGPQAQPGETAAPAPGDAPGVTPYTRLTILSPSQGQTIRTDTGRIEIRVDLQPALQETAGHRLVAIVDGTRIQGAGSLVTFLAGRGTHRAQVAVLDAEGNTLVRSGQISFDVRSDQRLPPSRELKAIQGIRPAN